MSAEGDVSNATGQYVEIRRRLEIFRPSAKVAFQRREVRLRTEAAFRVFEANFEHVSKSLYHLTCTLPIKARKNVEVIEAIVTTLEARFAAVEKEVSDGLARMRTLAKNDGADECSGYFNVEVLEVDILCPEVYRWVNLLTQVDQVIDIVNALNFATRLTWRERSQETQRWRNVAVRFSREIHNKHMMAEGAAERLARGETDSDETLDARVPEPAAKSKGRRRAQPAAVALAVAEVKRERSNHRRQETVRTKQLQSAKSDASAAAAPPVTTPAPAPATPTVDAAPASTTVAAA